MSTKGNLKPPASPAEARSMGRAGGIASAASRRKKAELRERLLILLNNKNDAGADGWDEIAVALYRESLRGNIRALEMLLSITGESRQVVNLPLPGAKTAKDVPIVTQRLLDAVGAGEVTPGEGMQVAAIVEKHLRALEMSELEQRISALEKEAGYGAHLDESN